MRLSLKSAPRNTTLFYLEPNPSDFYLAKGKKKPTFYFLPQIFSQKEFLKPDYVMWW
jgi:hypothetical protein